MLDIISALIGGALALGTFLGAGIGYYVAARQDEPPKVANAACRRDDK